MQRGAGVGQTQVSRIAREVLACGPQFLCGCQQQLIGLLDDVRDGQGVRIFIGAETRLFSLSGSAVIAAPYMTGQQRVLGAIGVIGPARLNYARVIPLVDYTARVLGRLLNG